MTRLNCSVTDCASNQNNRCCLPSIVVSGPSARSSEGTLCGSYVAKGEGEYSNSVHASVPNDALEITCSAESCTYNEGCRCVADGVSIDCGGGYSKSECSTYRPR